MPVNYGPCRPVARIVEVGAMEMGTNSLKGDACTTESVSFCFAMYLFSTFLLRSLQWIVTAFLTIGLPHLSTTSHYYYLSKTSHIYCQLHQFIALICHLATLLLYLKGRLKPCLLVYVFVKFLIRFNITMLLVMLVIVRIITKS